MVLVAISVISCSENSSSEDMTFEQVENEFNMKNSFSEISKTNILNRYGSVENYYEYLIDRKSTITKKVNGKKAIFNTHLFKDTEDIDEVIQCADDEYILDAAIEDGIDLPYSDYAGASPVCSARTISGAVDQSDQSFLSWEQLEQNFILLCAAYPMGDCDILTHQEENL